MVSSPKCFELCSGNAKLQPEPVIKDLVEKAGPTQGSSGVCNQPEWLEGVQPGSTPSQTSFKVGSGGRGILLEIPVCLRYSKGKQIFFFSFVSVSMAAVFGLIIIAAEDFATLLSLLCSPLHFNVTDLQPYKCLGIRWRIMECCNHTSLGKTALRPMAARLL